MRIAFFLSGLALLCGPARGQKPPADMFYSWAAIQQEKPQACFARSLSAGQRSAAASIGYWPARGLKGQFHTRLGSAARPGSAIILRVDGVSFQLVGSGINAWAPHSKADAAIVQAMRTGLRMSVETRSATGRLQLDRYDLRGAASAIDAAAIACSRR